jgi:hypothetical protein
MSSDAYLGFVVFAWHEVLARVEPMDEGAFWPLVAQIDWPARSHCDFRELGREHAARIGLRDAAGCYLAAIDIKDDLASRFDELKDPDIWDLIPSEDGMEDFLYHLVGQGREFIELLKDDLSTALGIAEDGSYVESLRYVLEGANRYYPVADYIEICSDGQSPAELRYPPAAVGSLVLASGQPAIVVRHDKTSVHLITPADRRDIALTDLMRR